MFQIRWLWENMKGVRFRYIIALIIALITPIGSIVVPAIINYVVDSFVAIEGNEVIYFTVNQVLPPLILMVLIHFVHLILLYILVILSESSAQVMVLSIRRRLFNNIMNEEMRFFQRYNHGDLMTRFLGDLDMCRHCVSFILRSIFENCSLFILSFTFLLFINWQMTLAVTAVLPLIIVIRRQFTKMARPLFRLMREKLADLNVAAQENIAGNRIVKAFSREQYEIEKFKEKNDDFRQSNMKTNAIWFKFWPFMEAISQSLTVTVALTGGIFAVIGRLTIGQLAAFLALSWALSAPMRMIGVIFNDLERFFTSANKVIEIFYAKPYITTRPDAVAPSEEFKGNITFRNVTFGYDSKKSILKNINLQINAGETVAIMGSTGSGKTTLLNLIPRFYDVKEGAVLIDGKDIRDIPIPDLRKIIGIASQDVFLFSDTIEGNIAYGDVDLPIDGVIQSARMADADEFISKMPEGYDTIIGERGVGLSGGQRQRIALARALAISPRILILDDTTSAVDLETEKYIQEQLESIPHECTKIIVAQRVSAVKKADKIIVLAENTIAEAGTHDELIALNGYYSEIYAIQSEGGK